MFEGTRLCLCNFAQKQTTQEKSQVERRQIQSNRVLHVAFVMPNGEIVNERESKRKHFRSSSAA
jgi:hypothetical protein